MDLNPNEEGFEKLKTYNLILTILRATVKNVPIFQVIYFLPFKNKFKDVSLGKAITKNENREIIQ